MALKLFRSLLTLSLILAALLAAPAAPAFAEAARPAEDNLPTLDTFIDSVKNGNAAQLRGVYVASILADAVVQQPSGQDGFVSPRQNILTQFAAASKLGSTGLLAHNYLAGSKFSLLQAGQTVTLVYGDGHTATLTVTRILRYQALQPDSPYSNFKDLATGKTLTASELFTFVYGRPNSAVFQTCITANGISTWGRLFVVADPSSSK